MTVKATEVKLGMKVCACMSGIETKDTGEWEPRITKEEFQRFTSTSRSIHKKKNWQPGPEKVMK